MAIAALVITLCANHQEISSAREKKIFNTRFFAGSYSLQMLQLGI
jgi:hypothetical protein